MNKRQIPEHLRDNCIMYCQSHGITKYRIVGNRYLVYNISFHGDYFNFQRSYTIQYKIDLETLQEVSRTPLKKFDKEALQNGRY